MAVTGARLTWFLMLTVISWLALRSGPGPEISTGADKLDHVAAFFALAFAAALGWGRLGATFFGLLAYGVLIELLQSRIPGRSAEAADVLADAIGIALGLSAYALVAWWTRRT
jgi:VanZ family protein